MWILVIMERHKEGNTERDVEELTYLKIIWAFSMSNNSGSFSPVRTELF